jgi:transposase-like protein
MSIKNKYVQRGKISEAKLRQLIKLFAHDLDAQTIASLTNLNRNTINRYLALIRKRLAEFCENQPPMYGEIEVGVHSFGARRIKGQVGRLAYKKTLVFGIFERGGKVYAEVVMDSVKATMQDIIRGRVNTGSVIYSDVWRGYEGLVNQGFKKKYRFIHAQNDLAGGRFHINGIESFWSFAKHRLMKFHGIAESAFYLHLKECEFRFNNRTQDIYLLLLKMFREKPLP